MCVKYLIACVLGIAIGTGAGLARALDVTTNLSWTAPTTKMDGTPLSPDEIAGFRVYGGQSDTAITPIAEVMDPAATEYISVVDLPVQELPHTLFYAVTTIGICLDGVGGVFECESPWSEVVSKTFLLGSTAEPTSPGSPAISAECGGTCVLIEQ